MTLKQAQNRVDGYRASYNIAHRGLTVYDQVRAKESGLAKTRQKLQAAELDLAKLLPF